PLITTLGGTCCRPRALRNRLNTTTILVNEVTITATNGASARPTTVTRMTPGLRLPKSIDLERQQLHPEHLAHRDELAETHARAVGPDHHPQLLEAASQLEDVTRLQGRELTQRQGEISKIEVEADRDVIRSSCGIWVRHDQLRWRIQYTCADREARPVVTDIPGTHLLVPVRSDQR